MRAQQGGCGRVAAFPPHPAARWCKDENMFSCSSPRGSPQSLCQGPTGSMWQLAGQRNAGGVLPSLFLKSLYTLWKLGSSETRSPSKEAEVPRSPPLPHSSRTSPQGTPSTLGPTWDELQAGGG